MQGDVERHYARDDLAAMIAEALRRAGKDIASLTPDDLAPFDQLHLRGRDATLELAERVGLSEGLRVLDVGSGLGGPSRLLAAAFGCRVTGIDITAAYCRAAATLAEWVRLDQLVDYRHGDALAMPFADAAFDVAWTQHAAMNIADKARLYREVARVLKPGGRFALYDILQGPGGPVRYPVPWAREPSISFLVEPAALKSLLGEAGFAIESWRDATAAARERVREGRQRASEPDPPPSPLTMLFGAEAPAIAESLGRNLEEDRIAVVEAVCRHV
ncbi:MAG TPA: methyltransferase domain-containing protein [Dongiaceae bacterium]|nr:methyltransferase domain-containing protein [Dongiaceae bacterium]